MASSQKAAKLTDIQALEDDERQYGHGPLSVEELNQKYPNRPHNHSQTMAFHNLFTSLFNPLNDNKRKVTGPVTARAKVGPHGPSNPSPHEARRNIIERFISRWRQEVGDDFYPALRLIIPEKDRDRAMYGLKEKAIGKLLVKLMKIDKNSEDGFNLLNWKLPGQTVASRMAGDFAGRCYEVILKRPMRTSVGDMRIAEVNELLDRLSGAQKEPEQLEIFSIFYGRMNADEMMWLIRIILRQMKVGATEKTFLELWHPDGEALFNVSSSLRRVCWELVDPTIRLEGDEAGVTLMQCFQPQLAQFQNKSFQKMVSNMGPTAEDPEFWIEEKLDGERMQLHMQEDESIEGGMRFGFWSRKAKDYTYLYGSGFEDEGAALTRHIKDAFHSGVRNLILDGEMITWDPEADMMVPFGTLKTAALSEQRNPFQGTGHRPLFRVFDILYLNDQQLTRNTLYDRRKALERCITDVHRRIEIHPFHRATKAADIEPLLRIVVAEASEGLVLKNPRSIYRLNSRNDDWMKVKPEYMTEFGESLDCVIIAGYYGSGHRGGRLSSFLCGLRVDQNQIQQGANPMKHWSFFKVGGGFKAEDYANIRHHTEGKWIEFDPKKPPTEYIALGGHNEAQYERPDVWIKPSDSIVVSVKAASVGASDQFRTGFTLRFPRFKRLRMDRSWDSALTIQEFIELKARVEEENAKEKEFKVDTRKRATKRLKKDIVIAGNEQVIKTPYAGPTTKVFDGLKFCVLSEALKPTKKSKAELEQLIKANGGTIFQSPSAESNMLVIADKKVVKVASIVKRGDINVIRPTWVLNALAQSEIDTGMGKDRFLIPFEPKHMYFTVPGDEEGIRASVDEYEDSYARDITLDELRDLLQDMPEKELCDPFDEDAFLHELQEHGNDMSNMKGWMFKGLRIFIDDSSANTVDEKDSDEVHKSLSEKHTSAISQHSITLKLAALILAFAGAHVTRDIHDQGITHVLVAPGSEKLPLLRKEISARRKVPRFVGVAWVMESWEEGTRLDEERYAV